LAEESAWRWIFFLNIPIVAICFIGVVAFIHLEQKVRSLEEIVVEFDWIGSTIFVTSTTSFLVPLSWGGIMYPWKSWRTIVPLILGICGWIAFAFYEGMVAKYPLIPIRIFRNRTTSITYMQDALQGIIML
jgi:MFS family permease